MEKLTSYHGRFNSAIVGRRIAARRRDIGMTLRELSERTGMSAPIICRIEQGRISLTVETLTKFAEALDVQEADLLQGREGDEELAATFEQIEQSGDPEDLWLGWRYFDLTIEEREALKARIQHALSGTIAGRKALNADRVTENGMAHGYIESDLELFKGFISSDPEERAVIRKLLKMGLIYAEDQNTGAAEG